MMRMAASKCSLASLTLFMAHRVQPARPRHSRMHGICVGHGHQVASWWVQICADCTKYRFPSMIFQSKEKFSTEQGMLTKIALCISIFWALRECILKGIPGSGQVAQGVSGAAHKLACPVVYWVIVQSSPAIPPSSSAQQQN